MGIGYVKVVFQPLTGALHILKDGNTFSPAVDPPTEGGVPPFYLKNSRRVRTLCEHKELLIKAQTVVTAG